MSEEVIEISIKDLVWMYIEGIKIGYKIGIKHGQRLIEDKEV